MYRNTQQHDVFLNHIMSCPSCRGMSACYCDTGRTLWIDDQAAFIAAQETRQEQAYWFKELRCVGRNGRMRWVRGLRR